MTPKIWNLFPYLTAAVRESHDEIGLYGHHDFFHAVRVGQMALTIAWDLNRTSAKLAGLAGLCHNADRLIQKQQNLDVESSVPAVEVAFVVDSWLEAEPELSVSDRDFILLAVMQHTDPHLKTHGFVTTALIDADHVINLGADDLFRLGQYLPGELTVLPRYPFNNPEAKFEQAGSLLEALRFVMEWGAPDSEFGVKLPLAKKFAARRVRFLQQFVTEQLRQMEEEGFVPCPDILKDWPPKA